MQRACPSVRLSVCMPVAKMEKNAILSKLSNLELWCLLTIYSKSYIGFSNTRAASTMYYSFLAARLSFTFIYIMYIFLMANKLCCCCKEPIIGLLKSEMMTPRSDFRHGGSSRQNAKTRFSQKNKQFKDGAY